MQIKARLFLLWVVYAAFLIWASGSIAPLNILQILLIAGGSLLGMLLPKIVTAFSEAFLMPASPGVTGGGGNFLSLIWQDSHSLMPATKVGQMIYSYPFLFAFGAVAFYVSTSTTGWFGKALVLGMGLRLCADLLISNRDKQLLKTRWFTAFATTLSDSELNVFVYGTLALFALLTLLALRS